MWTAERYAFAVLIGLDWSMSNVDIGSNTALESIDITEGQFPAEQAKQPSDHTSDSDKNRSSEEDIQSVIRTHEQRMRAAEIVPFDAKNHHLHLAYVRRDFESCLSTINEMPDNTRDECEFAAHIRGMISKELGDLPGALMWFEKASSLNRSSAKHYLDVGRVHFLQGQHKVAEELFSKAIEINPKGWKAYYWKAMAVYHLDSDSVRNIEKAQEVLAACPDKDKYADITSFTAKLSTQAGKIYPAIEAYKTVIGIEPENLDVHANLGVLYLRTDSEEQAFSMFGRALTYDNAHVPSILGAGYIIQIHGDYDVALNKYRVAAEDCDYNAALWNNIGMCFYGKKKLVACISCLKRANYLNPLDWKVLHNLGLAHNAMLQYASAYHFLSAAININPKASTTYMTLAIVLTNLNDFENARKAYLKAIHVDKNNNAQIRLNLAVLEYKQHNYEAARHWMTEYETLEVAGVHIYEEVREMAMKMKIAVRNTN
ncbi:hypothetical protein QR680_001919 [Steinernema hermaphroditum]|uniref:UDP-N-acetylglucosamine--peptide N-acetylglucosaminyltransferase SPINDLY n=1 Tax=Steinernema hermaphroditum TaxID=289476 RepID=A0AA39H0G9_9BILA|nr:hypothetical protein QR680_001919 [Steinernema hermaphroditum]